MLVADLIPKIADKLSLGKSSGYNGFTVIFYLYFYNSLRMLLYNAFN